MSLGYTKLTYIKVLISEDSDTMLRADYGFLLLNGALVVVFLGGRTIDESFKVIRD